MSRMDAVDEKKAVVAPVADEAESSKAQFLKTRGRFPGRFLVYDCNRRTLRVQNKSLVKCEPSCSTVSYNTLTGVHAVSSRRLQTGAASAAKK